MTYKLIKGQRYIIFLMYQNKSKNIIDTLNRIVLFGSKIYFDTLWVLIRFIKMQLDSIETLCDF